MSQMKFSRSGKGRSLVNDSHQMASRIADKLMPDLSLSDSVTFWNKLYRRSEIYGEHQNIKVLVMPRGLTLLLPSQLLLQSRSKHWHCGE